MYDVTQVQHIISSMWTNFWVDISLHFYIWKIYTLVPIKTLFKHHIYYVVVNYEYQFTTLVIYNLNLILNKNENKSSHSISFWHMWNSIVTVSKKNEFRHIGFISIFPLMHRKRCGPFTFIVLLRKYSVCHLELGNVRAK